MDAHSRRRALERYHLEQHEVDWIRKRIRRFFHEGQRCHGNDIVVLEQQGYNKFRLMVLAGGEWVHAVYHVRYCVFITFLPPPEEFVVPDLQTEVLGPNRVKTPTGVQI